jgi:hypothetical protein
MHEKSFMIDKIAPLYEMVIRIREDKPITSVSTIYSKKELEFTRKDGFIEFTLPKLEIYESIMVK